MSDSASVLFSAISEGIELFSKNRKQMTKDFLKISMFLVVSQLLLVFILIGINILGAGINPSDILGLALLLATLVIVVGWSMVNMALSSVSYCVIDERARGSKVEDIIRKTREIFPPIARYAGLWWTVFAVAIVLFVLTGAFLPWLAPLVLLALSAVIIAIMFAAQFTAPEIVIRKANEIDGIKRSYELAKKNLWTTLLLDIGLIIFVIVVIVVFSGIQQAVNTVLAVSPTNQIAVIPAMIFSVAISIAQTWIMTVVGSLLTYSFWKKLSGSEIATFGSPNEAATQNQRTLKLRKKK